MSHLRVVVPAPEEAPLLGFGELAMYLGLLATVGEGGAVDDADGEAQTAAYDWGLRYVTTGGADLLVQRGLLAVHDDGARVLDARGVAAAIRAAAQAEGN